MQNDIENTPPVAPEARKDAADAATAASLPSSSSSLSTTSSPGDDDIYDGGDPLVNFSDDEMRAFALMDALAKALLFSPSSSSGNLTRHTTHIISCPLVYLSSPYPSLSSQSCLANNLMFRPLFVSSFPPLSVAGPTSELRLNPGSSQSTSTTTAATSAYSPSTGAGINNSPRPSSSSSSSSSSTQHHHSRHHHSRRQAKAMNRNRNRSSSSPRSSGSGTGDNDDISTANMVSFDGSELALSSRETAQGQGLGQLSPADQVDMI